LCDLAFELGRTPQELSAQLSLSDLSLLDAYARKRLLPSARIELMLAQIAAAVTRYCGGVATASPADFLIGLRSESGQEEVEPDPDAVAASLGFSPVVRVAQLAL